MARHCRCKTGGSSAVVRIAFARTKVGPNPKPHAVGDERGRPRAMLLTEGQMSAVKSAPPLIFDAMPQAPLPLGHRGDEAGWHPQALAARGTIACIPSRKNRKVAIAHDATLYRQRYRIENMFGRLKDWRRIHTRYDRCAHAFMSAIALAAIVILWIHEP